MRLVATAGVWAVGEATFRVSGTLLLGPPLNSSLAADQLVSALGFPMLALVVLRTGALGAVAPWPSLGRLRPSALARGAVLAPAVLLAALAASPLDRLLFAQPDGDLDGPGVLTAIALLLVNGLVVPAAEEVAFRGVLQPAFVRRFGAVAGICATAALFSAKHVVVDASLGRLFTLFAVGVALGVVRHRLGLSAALGAHMAANVLATTGALLASS